MEIWNGGKKRGGRESKERQIWIAHTEARRGSKEKVR